jgi:hypothetical protein
MSTNITITNADKHFFLYSEKYKYEEDNKKYKKYKTKLVNYCFYTINEATISEKIKKTRYYSNNYAILEDYDFINISQLNNKIIEKLSLSNENEYLIFRYKNENLIKFNFDFYFKFHFSHIYFE